MQMFHFFFIFPSLQNAMFKVDACLKNPPEGSPHSTLSKSVEVSEDRGLEISYWKESTRLFTRLQNSLGLD